MTISRKIPDAVFTTAVVLLLLAGIAVVPFMGIVLLRVGLDPSWVVEGDPPAIRYGLVAIGVLAIAVAPVSLFRAYRARPWRQQNPPSDDTGAAAVKTPNPPGTIKLVQWSQSNAGER
jgi:hypothetical protein